MKKNTKVNSKFTPFPVLTSERLTLRQATKADLEEVFYLRSDKEINQYIKGATSKNMEEVKAFLEMISEAERIGKSVYWGINLGGNSKMIGSICLWNFSENEKVAEVGYGLGLDFQNQGIMSEALQCVLVYGFNDLGLQEIEAYTHHQNEASKRLLVKNGFHLIEGKKDEYNADNLVFGIKPRI
ncbi:MAG: GNAT family N-acetyltransferase [Chitinophagales bacterium]